MKTIAKMIAMIFLLGAGTWLTTQTAQAHRGISVQVFYDDLRPYGTWVDSPEYGYVWVPDVEPGFQPYGTSGYWTYTIYGWTWVSHYRWGWAPFHYGRWYFDNWYGWVWVPGYEWGPGWVSWRHCDGYFGWAPLTPGFHVTVNVNVNINIPAPYWVFLPERHFGRHDMDRYYTGRVDNDRLYRRSSVMGGTLADRETNARYYAGPEVREVSRATGRDFKPVEVRETDRPGQAMREGRMEVYRPKAETTAVRENRATTPERYTPSTERAKRPETPARYDRAPVERQMQVNNTPRQNQNQSNVRTERAPQPAPRQYQDNKRPEARTLAAPAKKTETGKTNYQAKPAEKKPAVQNRTTEPNRDPKNTPQRSSGGEQHKR